MVVPTELMEDTAAMAIAGNIRLKSLWIIGRLGIDKSEKESIIIVDIILPSINRIIKFS